MFTSNSRMIAVLVLLVLALTPIACSMSPYQASEPLYSGEPAIAYLRFADGYWQIWKTDPQGRNHQQLTFDPVDKVKISWSGTRRVLAAARSDGSVMLIKNDGATERLNLPFESILDARLSPDGEWLSISVSATQSRDSNDIWVVRTNGTDHRKLTRKAGVSQMAAWNAEGNKLVYSAGRGQENYQIWIYDLSKNVTEQVTVGDALRFEPVFTPAGGIIYSESNGTNFDIVTIDHQGKYRQLTRHPALDAQPALSAEGRYLLFYSQRGQAKRIWLKPMDGSGADPVALTPPTVFSRQPTWLDGY